MTAVSWVETPASGPLRRLHDVNENEPVTNRNDLKCEKVLDQCTLVYIGHIILEIINEVRLLVRSTQARLVYLHYNYSGSYN